MLIHGDREPVSCVVVMKLPNLGAPANLTNPRVSAIIAPRLEAAPGNPGLAVRWPHSTFGKCDVTLRVVKVRGLLRPGATDTA
jgi:hypothetical protein